MKFQVLPSRRHVQAFTLIELLIALVLVGIILAAVVYVNMETVRASASLQARNQLLPELQVTQNYMASKLRQAAYIFPNGSNIQMSVSGATTAKPPGGSTGSAYNWKVGIDPIIAFVLPPKTVTSGNCATATATTASNFCYAFYAFYAMKRDAFVAATSFADDPGTDAANDASSWVLVEYRAYYSPSATNFASGFSPASSLNGYSTSTTNIPTGNTGQLLMDFLPSQYNTGMIKLFTTNVASVTQAPGTATVTVNLAAFQNVSSQVVRLPGNLTTDFNTLVVYPSNVGKTPLPN